MKKLNLGSADTTAEGWINCDVMSGTNVDIVANAKYLYMQDKPEVIRASHVLEHIPPSETLYVLRTWHNGLREGGTLIIGNMKAGTDNIWPMTFILDWELIYRNEEEMYQLAAMTRPASMELKTDPTGYNYLLYLTASDSKN